MKAIYPPIRISPLKLGQMYFKDYHYKDVPMPKEIPHDAEYVLIYAYYPEYVTETANMPYPNLSGSAYAIIDEITNLTHFRYEKSPALVVVKIGEGGTISRSGLGHSSIGVYIVGYIGKRESVFVKALDVTVPAPLGSLGKSRQAYILQNSGSPQPLSDYTDLWLTIRVDRLVWAARAKYGELLPKDGSAKAAWGADTQAGDRAIMNDALMLVGKELIDRDMNSVVTKVGGAGFPYANEEAYLDDRKPFATFVRDCLGSVDGVVFAGWSSLINPVYLNSRPSTVLPELQASYDSRVWGDYLTTKCSINLVLPDDSEANAFATYLREEQITSIGATNSFDPPIYNWVCPLWRSMWVYTSLPSDYVSAVAPASTPNTLMVRTIALTLDIFEAVEYRLYDVDAAGAPLPKASYVLDGYTSVARNIPPAIDLNNLKMYLSGGENNNSLATSTGGGMSSIELVGNFSLTITSAMSARGARLVKCFYVKNTDTLPAYGIGMVAYSPAANLASTFTISAAIGYSGIDGAEPEKPAEGNIEGLDFVVCNSLSKSLKLPTIPPNSTIGIWLSIDLVSGNKPSYDIVITPMLTQMDS